MAGGMHVQPHARAGKTRDTNSMVESHQNIDLQSNLWSALHMVPLSYLLSYKQHNFWLYAIKHFLRQGTTFSTKLTSNFEINLSNLDLTAGSSLPLDVVQTNRKVVFVVVLQKKTFKF